MKNRYNSTLHGNANTADTAAAGNAPVRHVFTLGLDVDMRTVVTAIQCDRGTIALAQKFSRAQLIARVQKQIAARARSLVTTPMRLSPERRRKNDRLDARELCVRLARHLEEQAHELKPIRIPTRDEQARHELDRQRKFLGRKLRRLENHGRALRNEFEHQTLSGGWAGPRK